MALKPASTKASSSANEVFSSVFQPNTLVPSTSGAMRKSERPNWRKSNLPQARVDLVECGLPGAELFLAQAVERAVDRAQMRMQVLRLVIHVQEPGDDLAVGGVMLEEPKS